jgi:eukaryotic-like serine/threonine-protein kinase
MTLAPGTKLGPYELVAQLGAGGMGAVYRALDTRLGREVAVKVLPPGSADDPERLRRFQQEASATGLLNHPNLLAIFDVGSHEGTPYLVTELLEGQSLRERLEESALPVRKAVEVALQVARGLAAAHDKGVVHRDLKPENLFLTKDGRLKILDFGLAKLVPHKTAGLTDRQAATILVNSAETSPGVVLGTVGYMAPEQVRGEPADHRADIFSFGVILYEMLSGQRAFRGDSAIETLNAILKEDPSELATLDSTIPASIERVVRRCLEKHPEERFQSAHDLAFALETLSGFTSATTTSQFALPARPSRRRLLVGLACGVSGAAALAGTFALGRFTAPVARLPAFLRQAFRRGFVLSARFSPDGQSFIFSAQWDGKPTEVFMTRRETPEVLPLNFTNADILAISMNGEMALSLRQYMTKPGVYVGTLARCSLGGGAPRDLTEGVQWADWHLKDESLAIVRDVTGKSRLEFPVGTVLFESAGSISHPRFSPAGDRIAFLNHPSILDDRGSLMVVDLAGKHKELFTTPGSIQGLAWSPAGELWFTAADHGSLRSLRAVSVAGKFREILRAPGSLRILDIAHNGDTLMTRDTSTGGMLGLFPGEQVEHDLSWLDVSVVTSLSADGKSVLFTERGEGGGEHSSVYLRKTDGSPAVRLGEGLGLGFSPDGKWAIAVLQGSPARLALLPTGAGEVRILPAGPVVEYHWASWLPSGRQIAFIGSERDRGPRLFIQDDDGQKGPRPMSPEGAGIFGALSPDGRKLAAIGVDGVVRLVSTEQEGQPTVLSGAARGDLPLAWSPGGKSLYVARTGILPTPVSRLDLETGKRENWKSLMPADPTGIITIGPICITPDGTSYAYTYHRILSDLYLAVGLQ